MTPDDAQDAAPPRDPAQWDQFDQLGRALDGHPGHPWPDPSLAETADRLRALADRAAPPDPSPAFIHHLEETLMRHAAATGGGTVIPENPNDVFPTPPEPAPPVSVSERHRRFSPGFQFGATPPNEGVARLAPMNGHCPDTPIPSAPRVASIRPPRRLSLGALATAAAVVLLLGGIAYGGWLASSPGDDGGPGRLGAAQVATSAASVQDDGCSIAAGDTAAVAVIERISRLTTLFPLPDPVYERDLPRGFTASPEDVAEIEATVRSMVDCGPFSEYTIAARDDSVGPIGTVESTVQTPGGGDADRLVWFYSGGYLDRVSVAGSDSTSVWAPAVERGGVLTVRAARGFTPEQVGVIVDDGATESFVIFVEQDGRWLVDQVAVLTPPLATPEAFAPDYALTTQFGVNFREAPDGGSRVVDVLRPGERLQYLGEQTPTDDPSADGPRWLKFQNSIGVVGWLREIDVVPFECSAATWSMVPTSTADPTMTFDPTATFAVTPPPAAPTPPEPCAIDPTTQPEAWTMVPTAPADSPSGHATVTAIPDAMVATATADPTSGFAPTHQSNPDVSLNFRSEPSTTSGMATVISTVPPATPLMFLGETAPSEDPAQDGDRWLLFRLENGTEGWLREIDAEPYEASGA